MDGRCACDQGYVGYKCHLECETEVTDLTCSGHGVCNIIHAPVRPDMLETILSLDCNRSITEIIPLSRDAVIQTGSIIYHMYQEGSNLLVNTYRTGIDTIVSFTASTNVDYLVRIVDGNTQFTRALVRGAHDVIKAQLSTSWNPNAGRDERN